jgi:hypothetical protein
MAETALVDSGLSLEKGDHVCVFCRGQEERDQLLLPFLAEGLWSAHKCLAVLDTTDPAEVLDELLLTGPEERLADQLTVLTSSEVYLTERGFDMEEMLAFFATELRGVMASSTYDCIRTAGEMSWALQDVPGVEDLLAYEARVNQVLADHPDTAISLCLYDVDRFDGEMIVGVLRTHPRMFLSGQIVDNPFYVQPEEFLRQRAPNR